MGYVVLDYRVVVARQYPSPHASQPRPEVVTFANLGELVEAVYALDPGQLSARMARTNAQYLVELYRFHAAALGALLEDAAEG